MIQKLLLGWVIVLSVILFIVMGRDKAAAKQHRRRVPEATLLALAVIGGSAGGILGMLIFRHKTRHPVFFLGYPIILLCQAALGYFIFLR